MARKLSQMTWQEFKQELSGAGSPDNIIEIAKDIDALIVPRINVHCIPELINIQLALKKIISDFKHWERIERNRQHPKDNVTLFSINSKNNKQ
jgi:hypothetical protein